jgi:hypothetical protein
LEVSVSGAPDDEKAFDPDDTDEVELDDVDELADADWSEFTYGVSDDEDA